MDTNTNKENNMDTSTTHTKGNNMDTPTKTSARYVLTLPSVFFDDHDDRGCVEYSGESNEYIDRYIIRKSGKKVVVRLDIRDIADLVSDAHHYASSAADYGWEMQGVISSARATRNLLAKHGFTSKWMKQVLKDNQ